MPPHHITFPLALFLAGCSLFGDDDPTIEIRTDRTEYTPIPEESISLSISNESDDPIFYICTGQVYLEELSGGAVANRWMIHGFEECLSPEPIDVDQIEVFELGFDDKSALGNLDDAAFDESATYRLSVDLFWDQSFKRRLSEDRSRSNRFDIIRNPVQ